MRKLSRPQSICEFYCRFLFKTIHDIKRFPTWHCQIHSRFHRPSFLWCPSPCTNPMREWTIRTLAPSYRGQLRPESITIKNFNYQNNVLEFEPNKSGNNYCFLLAKNVPSYNLTFVSPILWHIISTCTYLIIYVQVMANLLHSTIEDELPWVWVNMRGTSSCLRRPWHCWRWAASSWWFPRSWSEERSHRRPWLSALWCDQWPDKNNQ